MVEFPYNHLNFAFWTVKRIHSKSYVHLPLIKWIFWYGNIFPKRLHSLFKFIRNMSWIETIPVYHFKVFRRQMNENLWDKFFSRHSNVSFLFIVSQIIEKEGNFTIINFGNLVFGNRWTCEISSEISDNTLCAVDVTVTDIKEESFVFFVKFGNSVQGLLLNFTVMIFSILNNFEDMVLPLTGNSIHIKMSHFLEVKIFSESTQGNNGMDVRIPFKIPSEGMYNRNQPIVYDVGVSEIFFGKFWDFIFSQIFLTDVMEAELKDFVNGLRKLWEEFSVIEEKLSAFFRYSKEYMAMFNVQDVFHSILGPDSGIFETAWRTKFGLTSKRELVDNGTERAFKFNETLRHIPASEELIDRLYNVFKMFFLNIIFLAKINRI